MSDLQIVLIVIGALIIAAVLLFNWWQERRFHQQVESSFNHLQRDALLDEPRLDGPGLADSKRNDSVDNDSLDDIASNNLGNDNFSISHHERDFGGDLAADYVEGHTAELDEYDNSAEQLPVVEASIEALYSELAGKAGETIQQLEVEYQAASTSAERKPAQHEEIKAIFEEVFSSASTTASDANNITNDTADAEANPEDSEEPTLSLPAMLHSQMDLTAVLYLATESTIGELNKALSGLFESDEKPVYVHALDSNKQWVLLKGASADLQTTNLPISRLACSLQLADRGGPVSRNALNRFQLAVETLGLDLNAHVEWQSSGDAVAAANALDAFCIDVDKTMGFHIVHGDNGAFTGTKLRGLAEAQGMTLSPDGTFKYFDEAEAMQESTRRLPSFIMFNRDQHPFSPEMLRISVVKAVTFQLDIPHVKHCAEAFNQMVQVARQMETGLNAVLVDDHNRVLSDIQIEKIRQQLKVIHAKMLVRGIVPGSDSALRLFS